MQRIGTFGILLSAIALCACASRLHGSVSYDEYADFSGFETVAFAPENPTLEEAPDNVQEARAIARSEIQNQLEQKGLRFAEQNEASLLIHFRLGTHQKVTSANATTGTVAGMQIEFADPKEIHVVWRGWAQLTWRQSMDRDTEIAKAVAYILNEFPPGASEG